MLSYLLSVTVNEVYITSCFHLLYHEQYGTVRTQATEGDGARKCWSYERFTDVLPKWSVSEIWQEVVEITKDHLARLVGKPRTTLAIRKPDLGPILSGAVVWYQGIWCDEVAFVEYSTGIPGWDACCAVGPVRPIGPWGAIYQVTKLAKECEHGRHTHGHQDVSSCEPHPV